VQSIAFCSRCRGMRVGWNGRYILHCMTCKEWISKSSKLLIFTIVLSVLVLGFPTPSAFVFSGAGSVQAIEEAGLPIPVALPSNPAVTAIETFLKKYDVDESHRSRVARAIIASSKKYDLDARLIASVMIVESRANPFAISNLESIGIMQIHLPTWGQQAEREGINLFKIEDNVDLGSRILKDYVHRFGLWEGVKRYNGLNPDNPDSFQAAEDYRAKVQHIYGVEKPSLSAELIK
jgi:soluble lytic murein transglycosylase-like protein